MANLLFIDDEIHQYFMLMKDYIYEQSLSLLDDPASYTKLTELVYSILNLDLEEPNDDFHWETDDSHFDSFELYLARNRNYDD